MLEESPKWQLLRTVLEEVRREVKTASAEEEEEEEEEEGSQEVGRGRREVGRGRVLVVVNDERTCYQLKQVSLAA